MEGCNEKTSPYETPAKNFIRKQLTDWESLHSPSITLMTSFLKKINRNILIFLHTYN